MLVSRYVGFFFCLCVCVSGFILSLFQAADQIVQLIQELEKQLEIEVKIKNGAEQLLRHYTLRKRQNKKSTIETIGIRQRDERVEFL